MEPLIMASSIWDLRAAVWPTKQRSPAGARWAVERIHRIEKMRHRESLIVGGEGDWVKPPRSVSVETFAVLENGDQTRTGSALCEKGVI
jgi:hypothetical protein